MIDQLKPGMTRRQVRYVMGTPLLEDTFTPNRWDYYYSKKDSDGELSRERVSIYFNGDILSHFSGDFAPSAAKAPAPEETDTSPADPAE
jgi:outer membrane protein assembly factor BamE